VQLQREQIQNFVQRESGATAPISYNEVEKPPAAEKSAASGIHETSRRHRIAEGSGNDAV
jgi:hypothetical protein